MLELRDFYHLPEVDTLIDQLINDGPGLRIVAGLDPRPAPDIKINNCLLPSGRGTIFQILVNQFLAVHRSEKCVVVTADKRLLRFPKNSRNQVELRVVDHPNDYAVRISEAVKPRPGLLVIDRLSASNASAVLEAAQQGVRALTQLDTVFRGAKVIRHLFDLGVSTAQLGGLTWILAVQRMATLCQHCKKPALPDPDQLTLLYEHYPDLVDLLSQEFSLRWIKTALDPSHPGAKLSLGAEDGLTSDTASETHDGPSQASLKGEIGTFFQAGGCPHCHHTGRQGDIAIFDIFRAPEESSNLLDQPSLLTMETYILHLACLGRLSLDDFLKFESEQFHHTFNLLVSGEQALLEAKAEMESRLIQLEASHRVLQQRTDALISLQEIGQALITSASLDELAARVCRRARDLCGADRVILYFQNSPRQVQVLSMLGWDPSIVQRELSADIIQSPEFGMKAAPFNTYPPGVLPRPSDLEPLQAGLLVPLIAQEERVGLMIVHTTQKPRFAPGEVALLQTFANQAALAIQRAGLIEQLRSKIDQLEAAQVELAQKERMEREMELARQVQQSVLPHTFPEIAGYRFAASNEPARQVGGDFYDVIWLDPEHFGIAIADVSDKGMPAALYMALTRSLLRAEARREPSPRSVISNVNQLLLELGEPDMFVSIFYGIIDKAARRMTYVCAGHDRPVLLRAGTAQFLQGGGLPLGILAPDDFQLAEQQLLFAPQDRLVLYTDGLTDAVAPDGKLFDRIQLKSLLQQYASLPADEICAAVFSSLAEFQGIAQQYDDMTLLVMEVE